MDFYRGRRLRSSGGLRALERETRLDRDMLIMPYFVAQTDERAYARPIASMPGICQYSLPMLEERVERAVGLGLNACLLFGIPGRKDESGSEAWNPEGIVQRAVRRLKERWPNLVVITDVCLCEYTSHGHCGLVRGRDVDNDATLELLARTALSHAEAGADVVAPSDMMDGRVRAIRDALDGAGCSQVPILSYAVKYASAFYGPFREAAGSAPQFGDRKSYQMDPANRREALREAGADLEEGADMLIVKPAGTSLDIIREVYDTFPVPVAAYQVSGEYAMLMAAAANGWLDMDRAAREALLCIARAGAGMIITYFTEYLLEKGLCQ